MAHFESLEEAREYFAKDRFATVNGAVIDELLPDGGCVCSMALTADHRNAQGNVMGGAIFTLADFALAVTSNRDHDPTVGLDADIRFLSSPKGERLIARGSIVKSGRTTSVIQVLVSDETGRDVALFTGAGFKL